MELRRYRIAMAVLAAANLILIWALPVLPCQDLPQHLSYARILMDHGDGSLPFRELYKLPERFEPYHTTYHLLAGLGRVVGLMGAIRLVMSAYVLGMLGAFHLLVRAAHRVPERAAPWTPVLVALVIWSPIVALGLLPFVLAMPVLLAGCALFLRSIEDDGSARDRRLLFVCAALLASTHLVAAGCFMLFVGLHALFVATKRARALALQASGAAMAVVLAFSLFGGLGVGGGSGAPFMEAYNRAFGFEFIDEVFQISWQPPTVKLGYVLWTLLGPHRLSGQILVAVVLGISAYVIHRESGPRSAPILVRPLAKTALAFAAVSLIVPWGFYVPSELTFLDLRMMTPAFALLLASIDPGVLTTARAKNALLAVAALTVIHFGFRAFGFASEAQAPLDLLAKAKPSGMMLPLTLHDRSAHFGKQFRLTHFLPMYYTALHGGPSAQFWARYTEHLPVDYLPGKEPSHPPDWQPWKLETDHLDGKAWVLVEAPDEDDPRSMRADYTRLRKFLDDRGETVGAIGPWSLHRIRPAGQ